jgi:hypothetical protein
MDGQTELVALIQDDRLIAFGWCLHDAYVPYSTKEPHFEMEAAPRGLGAKFRYPPPIDRQFLHRLLSYARQWHWDVDRKRARVDA